MNAQRIFHILLFVKFAVGLSSDGFCQFVETYTDQVTAIELVTSKGVVITRKCFYNTKICYDYPDQTRWERVTKNVQKTRIVQKCCRGYKSQNSRCVSVCSIPCLNGVCTAPDLCVCSTGFHKNRDGICVKNECDPADIASDQCENGKCTPDGICACNDGFVKGDSYAVTKSKCVPICSEGCLNGNCVAPETCVCNSGHQAVNSSVCDPICQNECVFGTCTRPDECTCFEGYQQRNGSTSTHVCDPVCSGGCLNGKCESPDLCTCDGGYTLSEESDACEPVCVNGCVNSNCTSPNVCTCDEGICVCDSGFAKNGTRICSPICSLECNECNVFTNVLSHNCEEVLIVRMFIGQSQRTAKFT